MTFNVGDRVFNLSNGKTGTVQCSKDGAVKVCYDDCTTGSCKGHPEKYYALIIPCDRNNKVAGKPMSLIAKLMLSLKSEPEKSFIKAGISNADRTFTCEGKELFINWLFQDSATQTKFNTEVVQPLLEQMKEDSAAAK